MTQFKHFLRREGDLLPAELERFLDLHFFHRAGRVLGRLRGDPGGDLGLLAVEPDVAASFGFLPLEDDVALDRNFEARAEFEGQVGEEGALRDGFGVDGREERGQEGDPVTLRGGGNGSGDGDRCFGVG